MAHAPTCRTSGFFLLRSPALPHDALGGADGLRGRLAELARDPAVREALALASPDLAGRLEAWAAGTLESREAARVDRALLRYLGRMSQRCTPFGLFAAVSLGTWDRASRLHLGAWRSSRRSVRLDWGVLERLADRLAQDPAAREAALWRPNTSLYAHGGWYRYFERREGADGGRTYHLEAVEASPHLDRVLARARDGARLAALAEDLAGATGAEPAEARAFLDALAAAQVLCPDLQPPLTAPDPLGHLAAAGPADPAPGALSWALAAFAAAPPGAFPDGPAAQVAPLAGDAGRGRDLVQVDLFRPAEGLALSAAVRRALEAGAETLRRLAAPSEGPLDRFRAAFQARYEGRWRPLLAVLDEESGLGFDGTPTRDCPLLEGLSFGGGTPARPLSAREARLLDQLVRRPGEAVLELDDPLLEALAAPGPPPFPASFAALAVLSAASPEALDRGDFRFWMAQYSGASAARWLGRFASGDPALAAALGDHLRREEAQRPDAVHAEVVHVPEGRMGNVLARPALRDWEIPFLAAPGVPEDRTLRPDDLWITVRGDRIHLASRRLGREVLPRLASAHNFTRGPVVYRFLAHLQGQDGRPGGWTWGALGDLPFLPRVVRGRHVLSLARWRIEARELAAARARGGERPAEAFQALREARGLPRVVVLADGDNHLRVDLDQPLWAETLHHLVRDRADFRLEEAFPAPGEALVAAPEGGFAHELVVPFEGTAPLAARPAPLAHLAAEEAPRSYPPGSEWLYLKAYAGPADVDRLLERLAPFLRATEGLWDRWHFVRYQDPDFHLRLRFHGAPDRLAAELLPRLRAELEGPLARGLVRRIQLDTFEPELERYGGPEGFGLAEAWFHADSRHVLDRLAAGGGTEDRWKAGLEAVDALWAALGLTLADRRRLAEATRDSLRREFGDEGAGSVQIGRTFRTLRGAWAGWAPAAPGSETAPGAPLLARLREAAGAGRLREDLPALAGSLAHMHLNRLLRADHRETEWVLMDFLARFYAAAQSRA